MELIFALSKTMIPLDLQPDYTMLAMLGELRRGGVADFVAPGDVTNVPDAKHLEGRRNAKSARGVKLATDNTQKKTRYLENPIADLAIDKGTNVRQRSSACGRLLRHQTPHSK